VPVLVVAIDLFKPARFLRFRLEEDRDCHVDSFARTFITNNARLAFQATASSDSPGWLVYPASIAPTDRHFDAGTDRQCRRFIRTKSVR
jgi:hypothetical protein